MIRKGNIPFVNTVRTLRFATGAARIGGENVNELIEARHGKLSATAKSRNVEVIDAITIRGGIFRAAYFRKKNLYIYIYINLYNAIDLKILARRTLSSQYSDFEPTYYRII